jgi:molecular chaperone GrpE (heat shock protein)
MPNEEHPVNTVIEEVQTGFRLFDRVVRPSQVVLSAGKPAPSANDC